MESVPSSESALNLKLDNQKMNLIVSISVALLVIFISIALYWFKKKSSRNFILFTGLSFSGKTTLFTQLGYKTFVSTVTSMKENTALMKVKNNKTLTLIDLPGFDRLRNQFWELFKPRAKAIIYVIDSVNFMSNVHTVADLLYQYLSDEIVISNRLPVLVACTKQDATKAKAAKAISTILEKEFNSIRETRIGALDSTDEDMNRNRILGDLNHPFKFSDLRNQIEFVECNAHDDNKNIGDVFKWIETIA